MSAAGLLRFAYYAYLSRPSGERVLYRAISRHRLRSIVELGLGGGLRAERMIRVAQRKAAEPVRYTGIDLFELRGAGETPLGIKQAYHQLRGLGAKVQLAPGDPFSALARTANSLAGTDLLVVSPAAAHAESLARAWFYVPRMLHAGSQVFLAEPAGEELAFRRLARIEIERLAAQFQRHARRAA